MFGIGVARGEVTNGHMLILSAVLVAGAATLVAVMIVGLRKVRGISRQKGIGDRASEIKAIRTADRQHIELESRVLSNESKVTDTDDAVRAIHSKAEEISDRVIAAEKRSIVIMGMCEQLLQLQDQAKRRTPDA